QVAMEKLELAVRQDPEHAPAHMALGIVNQSINRNEKALEHLKTAVRLAPEDGAAHNTYAVLLCRVGRYAEADRHFQAALEDPFYQTPEVVLANAGSCARRAGETEQAEQYLRLALEFNPRLPEALFNLAELSLRQGRALPARGFLQRLESGESISALEAWIGTLRRGCIVACGPHRTDAAKRGYGAGIRTAIDRAISELTPGLRSEVNDRTRK
ncbi:MAG: tetratricopeptide repeat protein, partial [Wenzhouxiangellaceae bacterium]